MFSKISSAIALIFLVVLAACHGGSNPPAPPPVTHTLTFVVQDGVHISVASSIIVNDGDQTIVTASCDPIVKDPVFAIEGNGNGTLGTLTQVGSTATIVAHADLKIDVTATKLWKVTFKDASGAHSSPVSNPYIATDNIGFDVALTVDPGFKNPVATIETGTADLTMNGTSVHIVAHADTVIDVTATQITCTVTASAGTGTTLGPLSQTVPWGTSVTLTGGLLPGYKNLVIAGNGGTQNGNTFTIASVTADTVVTSSAAQIMCTVTAQAGTGTTLTPATQTVVWGSTVTLNAGLSYGYANLVVSGGNGTLVGGIYTITNVQADITVTSSATKMFQVSFTSSDNTVNNGANPALVLPGGSLTTQLIPDIGYQNPVAKITSGTGTVVMNGVNATITPQTDLTVALSSSRIMCTITAQPGTGTTLTPATQQVPWGSTATLTAALLPHYKNLNVNGGGGSLTGNTFTMVGVTGDITVTSTADPILWTITAQAGVGTQIGLELNNGATTDYNSPWQVQEGARYVLSIGMSSGYKDLVVTGPVTATNVDVSGSGEYTTTNPVSGDITVSATATLYHTVTASAEPGTHISPLSLQVKDGDTPSFAISSDQGYGVFMVSVSGVSYSGTPTTSVTLSPVHADGAIIVRGQRLDGKYALQRVRMSDNTLFLADFPSKQTTIEVFAYNAPASGSMQLEYWKNEFDANQPATKVTVPLVLVPNADGLPSSTYRATFATGITPRLRLYGGMVDRLPISVVARDAGGTEVSSAYAFNNVLQLGVVSESVTAGLTTTNDPALAYSANAVNVICPTLADSTEIGVSATNVVYAHYDDSFQTIALVPVGTWTFVSSIGQEDIRNNVAGLGKTPLDIGMNYGSASALESFTLHGGDTCLASFVNMFAHLWGNYYNDARLPLGDPNNTDLLYPGPSVGQFANQHYLELQGDGSYIVRASNDVYAFGGFYGRTFSDFEMYMLGFSAPAQVNDFVMAESNPAVGSSVAAANVKTVRLYDVQTIYGARNPAYNTSPKSFNVLVVGLSERPMTSAEMSLLSYVSGFHASQNTGGNFDNGGANVVQTPRTFWSATGGLGTIVTSGTIPVK